MYIENTMNASTETPDPKLCTLRRPAGTTGRTWTDEAWQNRKPDTTFVALGERVWLLTAGPRSEWRCMSLSEARAEWRRLVELGYTRSEQHTVEVVAVAQLHADRKHEIDHDCGLGLYRAGTAHAGLCPVLRSLDRRYRHTSWTVCLDVTITDDTTSIRKIGSKSVETRSVYGYEVATGLMEDEPRGGWSYYGVAEDIGAERISRPDGSVMWVAVDVVGPQIGMVA